MFHLFDINKNEIFSSFLLRIRYILFLHEINFLQNETVRLNKIPLSVPNSSTSLKIYLRTWIAIFIMKFWRIFYDFCSKISNGSSSNGNDWNSFDFSRFVVNVGLIKSHWKDIFERKMCSRLERHKTSHYHSWHAEDFLRYLFYSFFFAETNDRLIATGNLVMG